MSEHCFFCGRTLIGPERQCERCGAVRESRDERRVRAPCPRCHGVRLFPFALGSVALQTCARCKGSFVATADWDVLLEEFLVKPLPEVVIVDVAAHTDDAEERSPYRTAAATPVEEEAVTNLADAVRCPTCDEVMDRLEFAGISGTITDVCKLHGVWLDAGELERIVDLVRRRAAPPRIVPDPLPRVVAAQPKPEPVNPASMASFVASLRASAEIMEADRREEPPMLVPPDRRDERLTEQLGRTMSYALRPLKNLWRWLRLRR